MLNFVVFGRIMEQVDKNFDEIAPQVLDYNYTIPESKRNALTQLIRQYYFKESANLHDFITVIFKLNRLKKDGKIYLI